MKFQQLIDCLDCEYEIEKYSAGKIVRIKRSHLAVESGVRYQTANDIAFYFDADDELEMQIGGEDQSDTDMIRRSLETGSFAIEDGVLTRKRI